MLIVVDGKCLHRMKATQTDIRADLQALALLSRRSKAHAAECAEVEIAVSTLSVSCTHSCSCTCTPVLKYIAM